MLIDKKCNAFCCKFCCLGCVRGVVGEGMPFYRRPFDKGNLYIKFEIEFPPSNFIPEDKIEVGDYTLYKVFFFFNALA